MSLVLKVIQAQDPGGSEIIRRVPEEGTADINMGSVCVVEESQVAIFFRDDQVLDLLGPGRHVLSTQNLPVITDLLSLPYGGKSPFQAAVFFVNQKVFTGMKWGTRQPVAFRDRELGVVRLRAHGVYAMRVADPVRFLNTLGGTRGVYTSAEVEEYLKDVVVSRLNDLMGERLSSLLDLPALYNELATETRLELKQDFGRFGIDLIDFFITSVTPTEEVQKALEDRAGIGTVGNLQDYLQVQAGRTPGRPEGESGEKGGDASRGLGTGVGGGMGLLLPQAFLGRGGIGPAASGFCPHCGGALNAAATCMACHKDIPPGSSFCPRCGAEQKKQQSG